MGPRSGFRAAGDPLRNTAVGRCDELSSSVGRLQIENRPIRFALISERLIGKQYKALGAGELCAFVLGGQIGVFVVSQKGSRNNGDKQNTAEHHRRLLDHN